jgi:hypothetical protein
MRGGRAAVTLISLILVFSMVACGRSQGTVTRTAPRETAAPATPATQEPRNDDVSPTDGGVAQGGTATPTAADGPLAPALLTLNDLPPAGCIVVPPTTAEANDPSRQQFLCGSGDHIEGAQEESEIHFHDSSRGAILYHTVAVYPRDVAKQGMDAIAEKLKTCTTWTADSGGATGTFSISPVRLPERGEQTIAFRLVVMDDSARELGMMNVVMTRNRDAVSTISFFAPDAARLDKDTDTYARIAEERLAKLVGIEPTRFTVGETVHVSDSSSATVHSVNTDVPGPIFQDKNPAVIDVEVCAGTKPVQGTSQYNFALRLADQSIGEQIGSLEGYPPLQGGDLAPEQCARGFVATAIPADQTPTSVVYTIPNPTKSGSAEVTWDIP